MIDQALHDAAYHEAGHFVMAHTVGYSFSSIEVWPWPEKLQYKGQCSGSRPKLYPDQHAQIALAGMLAEAKYGAMRTSDSPAEFAATKISELLAMLRDRQPRSEDEPGEFVIEFRVGSGLYAHVLSDFSYSGTDKRALIRYSKSMRNPASLIVDTMSVLDEPARWSAIEGIATALAVQTPVGVDKRRRLGFADVLPFLG